MILSLLSGPGMVLEFPNMVILVICEYELVQKLGVSGIPGLPHYPGFQGPGPALI